MRRRKIGKRIMISMIHNINCTYYENQQMMKPILDDVKHCGDLLFGSLTVDEGGVAMIPDPPAQDIELSSYNQEAT